MTVVVILLIRRKYRGGAELGGGGAGRQISKPDLLSPPARGEAQPETLETRGVSVSENCVRLAIPCPLGPRSRPATAAVGNLTPATMLCPGNWKLCHFFPAPRNYTVFCDIDSLCYTENKYNTHHSYNHCVIIILQYQFQAPARAVPRWPWSQTHSSGSVTRLSLQKNIFELLQIFFYCYKYFFYCYKYFFIVLNIFSLF